MSVWTVPQQFAYRLERSTYHSRGFLLHKTPTCRPVRRTVLECCLYMTAPQFSKMVNLGLDSCRTPVGSTTSWPVSRKFEGWSHQLIPPQTPLCCSPGDYKVTSESNVIRQMTGGLVEGGWYQTHVLLKTAFFQYMLVVLLMITFVKS